MNDPLELIRRIPELEALQTDAKIHRALQRGEPFKVYRALQMALLFRRLPQQTELLRMLTAQRRLFARPTKNKPLVGGPAFLRFGFIDESESRSQHDTDGSYLAQNALTLFKRIPVLPLSSFVVKPQDGGKWETLAQVPRSVAHTVKGAALISLLACIGCASVLLHYKQATTQELIVINGFTDPLIITLDSETIRVPAQASKSMRVRIGDVAGTAVVERQASKIVIDRFQHKIVGSDLTSIWNVAGATPILANAANSAANNALCGQQFIEFPSAGSDKIASLRFLELPTKINLPTPSKLTVCRQVALQSGDEKNLLGALEAQALMHDWELESTRNALDAAKTISSAEAVRVARRALDANPEKLVYQRLLQEMREDAGEQAALLEEFTQRAKQMPTSPAANFLAASLITGDAGVTAMQSVSDRFPQDVTILRSLVWRKGVHGYYAEALKDLGRLRKLAPGEADSLFDLEIRLLLSQGRGLEAIRMLSAVVRDKLASNRMARAADFAYVARQSRVDPEFWVKDWPPDELSPDSLDFYRVRAGFQPYKSQRMQTPFVTFALALRNDPARALQLAKSLDRLRLNELSKAQLALLFGEAARTNDVALMKQTRHLLGLSQFETDRFNAFVRGEADDIDTLDVDLDIQAAAFFIRARNPQISAAERSKLRSRAARTDILRAAVSTAISQWQ